MKVVILFITVLCSCRGFKSNIYRHERNFIEVDGKRFISATINQKEDYPYSGESRTVIYGKKDTIYLFSTILSNAEMLYSGKNLSERGKRLYIESYYPEFMSDAPHSGIKKFNFIEIAPNDSLVIDIDLKKILFSPNKAADGVFLKYHYFEKQRRPMSSKLIDIDNINFKTKTIKILAKK